MFLFKVTELVLDTTEAVVSGQTQKGFRKLVSPSLPPVREVCLCLGVGTHARPLGTQGQSRLPFSSVPVLCSCSLKGQCSAFPGEMLEAFPLNWLFSGRVWYRMESCPGINSEFSLLLGSWPPVQPLEGCLFHLLGAKLQVLAKAQSGQGRGQTQVCLP